MSFSYTTAPIFNILLEWEKLTIADAETIFDFYSASAKAKGMARTFEFPHPTDGATYIVRFIDKMAKNIMNGIGGIAQVRLRVIGKKA